MMNEVLYHVVWLVVAAVSVLIARYAIPYLKAANMERKLMTLIALTDRGVKWAEKILGEEPGDARNRAVADFLMQLCEQYSIDISYEQLQALIEASVKQMEIEQGNFIFDDMSTIDDIGFEISEGDKD